MKPVLKYGGGKAREIKEFERYIPKDYERYIEPFFGGGAVYFHLMPEQAIINDCNKKLMDFYIQLRDLYPIMSGQLETLQSLYSDPTVREALYYDMRERFNYPDGAYLNSVVYYFINRTVYGGMTRYNKKNEFNVPFGWYENFNTEIITEQHSIQLRKTVVLNTDYSNVFKLVKPDDFIFLDPPYDCAFNGYGNIDTNGFFENEHRKLAKDFTNLQCRALMIVGKTELTQELYKDYICGEYNKKYSFNIRNRNNREMVHMIVKNYSLFI